jgi:hypothetical protein
MKRIVRIFVAVLALAPTDLTVDSLKASALFNLLVVLPPFDRTPGYVA